MAHVLVMPFPGQSHMNPMVQFARLLASKGVATTLVTTRFIARTSGVDARPAMVEAISDGHDEGGYASAASMAAYLEKQAAAASASFASLIEARASSPPPAAFTCVVYDSFEGWVRTVARRMDLPAVPFSTQSCSVSAVYYHFTQGRLPMPPAPPAPAEHGGGGGARSEAFQGLPEMERSELPSFVYDDGPYPQIAKNALNQFAHVHAGKDDWVLAGLTNYMKARAIGPCVPLPAADTDAAGHITYGPNLLNPEDACMKWLDTKPPSSVAYVSFGSFASLGAAQSEELARGLLAAGRPFLWVVRAAEEPQLPRHLLDELTASGAAMIVRWCPQLDVLAHPPVGCFLTHCGWNSTLEALSFGVPMVALGLWTDQPTNARYVERAWGAGVRAHRDAAAGLFLRGEVERCVRAVMDDDGDGEAAARRAARRWGDKAHAATAAGGSSDRNLDEFVEFVRAGAVEKWKK
ncbi:hypothetical protein U9M48_034974, partial [Paspalum notatum var. saurae]